MIKAPTITNLRSKWLFIEISFQKNYLLLKSVAFTPPGHDKDVVVIIFAVCDSWGLFTQNVFPGKVYCSSEIHLINSKRRKQWLFIDVCYIHSFEPASFVLKFPVDITFRYMGSSTRVVGNIQNTKMTSKIYNLHLDYHKFLTINNFCFELESSFALIK